MRFLTAIILLASFAAARAEVEVDGWGELRGVRVDGELFSLRTRITAAMADGKSFANTGRWETIEPDYRRAGDGIVTSGRIGSAGATGLHFRQTVSSHGDRGGRAEIELSADNPVDLAAVQLFVRLPPDIFGAATAALIDAAAAASPAQPIHLATTRPSDARDYVHGRARGAIITGDRRSATIRFDQPQEISIRDERGTNENSIAICVTLYEGRLAAGARVGVAFDFEIIGEVDHAPATITIAAKNPGRSFGGVGGNFVFQTDAPATTFYLDHLKLAYGRVAAPMDLWQPRELSPRADNAATPAKLQEALRMAAVLAKREIPTIVSVWDLPAWALSPKNDAGKRHIDATKWPAVAKAISSYLLEVRRFAGREPELFSFNEPDLGVNVAMSADEHRDAIKILGKQFKSAGLKTKLILGDTARPIGLEYLEPTRRDPDALRYVGAVAFHSWNVSDGDLLEQWSRFADEIAQPLLVTEGGFDANAWRYRRVMDETWYALDEIAVYVKCLSLAQPAAMLHWELTPDYGLLRKADMPKPPATAMRWNAFKQFETYSPAGSRVAPATSDCAALAPAALVNDRGEVAVIHIVNASGERRVSVKGVLNGASWRMTATTANSTGSETSIGAVENGEINFTLPADAFVTLTGK